MASKQLSWMDEKTVKGESPRQRLQRIAAAMGIHPKHIEFVLTRFGKLKDTGTVRGRAQTDLILAAAYDYLRWEGSGLQPKSPKDFIAICKGCGIRITRSRLLMSSRLFKQAGLYPKTHLTVEQLLDKRWK